MSGRPLALEDNQKPAVLVTGGAGFIGSHLCDALLNKGYTVRCYDDLSFGSINNIAHQLQNDRFHFFENDIRDLQSLINASTEVSLIIHLAARKIPRYGDALLTLNVNNEGAENVFEAALKNQCKVVLASTSDVYGKGVPPFKESDDLLIGRSDIRRWSYAVSKLFDEHLALAYHHEKDVPTVILRFFGTYGPRHHRSWWGGPQSVFIDQILKGEEITVHGDGSQTRSFTYIDDLISGIIKASEINKAEGEIINLGSDQEISILDLARLIGNLIDNTIEPRIKFVPYESFGRDYEDVLKRIPDLTKARNLLGFDWRVNLADGLVKTISWHKENPIQ